MAIASIPEIVADIKAGKMVILTDAEDRENEGDLLMAAEFVTPEAINFMIKHARGLVCMPMNNEMVDRLQLPMMADRNGARHGTPFTVSIEAAQGISTGISAADRAHTVRTAVAPNAVASDIVQPGHIFPLRAQDGGVLVRAGHTEAGCDLARMAGLTPAAVICEVINDDGTMARMPELEVFAEAHGIKIATIADLIQYRSQHESLIEVQGSVVVDTDWGQFKQVMFTDTLSQETHIALVKGEPTADDEVLVRVHEPFSALDFLAPSDTHSWSLPDALSHVQAADHGVVILLHRTETGADLLAKALPQNNPPRVWDKKTFGIGAQILASLNVKKMRIMGKPSAMTGLTGFGLEVTGFEMPKDA
ncbi:MAG: 3,4-dihydroxy-2-butanone-4-phosphate synthase [Neisseriaceae bacterium]|nr:3,4-dihydroxy-2-butanone-4-phosphate synthase [Neisseriaceae bacterium]